MGKFDERKFDELNQKVDNLTETVKTMAAIFDYTQANAAAGNSLQPVIPPVASAPIENNYWKNAMLPRNYYDYCEANDLDSEMTSVGITFNPETKEISPELAITIDGGIPYYATNGHNFVPLENYMPIILGDKDGPNGIYIPFNICNEGINAAYNFMKNFKQLAEETEDPFQKALKDHNQ